MTILLWPKKQHQIIRNSRNRTLQAFSPETINTHQKTPMGLSCNIPWILEPSLKLFRAKLRLRILSVGTKKGKILNLTFGAHSIMGKSSLSLFLAFDAVQRFANHDLGMIILNFLWSLYWSFSNFSSPKCEKIHSLYAWSDLTNIISELLLWWIRLPSHVTHRPVFYWPMILIGWRAWMPASQS